MSEKPSNLESLLEPESHALWNWGPANTIIEASIAISLKRIADALEQINLNMRSQ
jgi:hypothetical protein